MTKKRVSEWAKDHGLSNTDLLAKLESIGVTGLKHSNSVEEAQVLKAIGKTTAQNKSKTQQSTILRPRRADAATETTENSSVAPAVAASTTPATVVRQANPSATATVVRRPANATNATAVVTSAPTIAAEATDVGEFAAVAIETVDATKPSKTVVAADDKTVDMAVESNVTATIAETHLEASTKDKNAAAVGPAVDVGTVAELTTDAAATPATTTNNKATTSAPETGNSIKATSYQTGAENTQPPAKTAKTGHDAGQQKSAHTKPTSESAVVVRRIQLPPDPRKAGKATPAATTPPAATNANAAKASDVGNAGKGQTAVQTANAVSANTTAKAVDGAKSADAQKVTAVTVEPKANVAVATPEVVVNAASEEHTKTDKPSDKVIDAKADQPKRDKGSKEPAATVVDQAAPSPTNIVRMIDPKAIQDRLAAERRSFAPRNAAPAAGGNNRRPISKIREIEMGAKTLRPTNDAAAGQNYPAAAPTAAPAPSTTANSGDRKKGARTNGGTSAEDLRDRRDRRGGRDIWLDPEANKKGGKKGKGKQTEITQAAQHKRVVEMTDAISVADLAHQMAVKSSQVIAKLMGMGMLVTVNQTVDFDTASIISAEFGFEVKDVTSDAEDLINDSNVEMIHETRPPVVTIMGHVDHGKTSLLDALRNANVAAHEAGGITQHIGAYSVETRSGQLVTFLDTPGHEAFTAMRARGAKVTDVVVIVVAADDGVMPQTVEAINHAKNAKVPIVVAINKIDRPEARPERIMQQLTEYGLVSEEWGGDVMMVPVSAKQKIGLDDLLERILLQAEVLDLKAPTEGRAVGTIVEAQLDKGRGPVATVLIQSGTLCKGDYIVAGQHAGKVRAMYTSNGKLVTEATPSTPVQVLGLSGVPIAGDMINAVADDKTARSIAEQREQKAREEELKRTARVSLENFLKTPVSADESQTLRLIVKADVGGSVEALCQSLVNLSTRKVKVSIVHSGVGTITENDVNLALTADAIVIGFNVKPDVKAQAVALHEQVDVRTYGIIYEVIDEIRAAMAGLLAPKLEERFLGRAEVRAVFSITKVGTIAGCYISEGKVNRTAKVRVRRASKVVFEGQVNSIKRNKDDVKEVALGFECGIGIDNYTEFQVGDVLEFHYFEEVKADLGEALNAEEKENKRRNPGGVFVSP